MTQKHLLVNLEANSTGAAAANHTSMWGLISPKIGIYFVQLPVFLKKEPKYRLIILQDFFVGKKYVMLFLFRIKVNFFIDTW